MQEKRDLRVQKTYDGLIEAFQDLLNEKSFEEITVKELCSRAKTRTATFYSHFSDKYDFFSFMIKESRKSFAEKAETEYKRSNPMNYYTTLMECALDYFEEHNKMANSIKNNDVLAGMLQFTSDEMTEKLKQHLNGDSAEYAKLNHPEIMIHFLMGGMNQVTQWWFTNRKSINKDEVIADMNVLLKKILKS